MNEDIQAAEEMYKEYEELFGDTDPTADIENFSIPEELNGIVVNEWTNGWGFRAYGGLSINLWFIKIDASVMYDILGKSLGAQVGLRLQF